MLANNLAVQNSAPKIDRMTSHSPIRQTIDLKNMKPKIHRRLTQGKKINKKAMDLNNNYLSSKHDLTAVSLFSMQDARI